MHAIPSQEEQRRRFLKWISASPLLALPGSAQVLAQDVGKRADPAVWPAPFPQDLITSPKDAINIFDFEAVAYKKVPPAHFGYMASGIDDEVTLRANRSAFLKYQLRPRRMRDVSKVDMSVTLFGTKWKTPIIMAPTGGNRAYDPDGEIAVARAARAGGHLNVLASAAGSAIEDVIAARQGEVWYQLYATSSRDVAVGVVKRVERAGCPVLEITVDRNGGRNQETFFRLRRQDTRPCAACHIDGVGAPRERPNYDGIDLSKVESMQTQNMTWDFIKLMRDTTKMKLVVKGILTAEDAELCLKYGVDGIHVSNHGGRSEDNGRGAIECLPEVAKVAKGKVPIIFDSGVRRGTDIVKALAMGASAVEIGRPYLWGLGAFGQPGVERVLEILRDELSGAMQQMGAANIAALVPEMVIKG
jgi:4-hydroxymandelate oxidase